jgi:uncharacterized phiE125 gp8 family phage protein
MSLTLITPPAVEPVSLADMRVQCSIDAADTGEDALLAIAIVAAREEAEHELQRALINQTWELRLDAFPAAEIRLDKAQARSITSVMYVDAAGDLQTLSSGAYVLDSSTAPGWLLPAAGTSWPATADVANAVRVQFVAGYGATADAVPASVRYWIMVNVATRYAQREAIDLSGKAVSLPGRFIDRGLDPHRFYG